MSSIVDLPVRVCNKCLAVYMEDENMYEEPDRCPHCGAYPEPVAVESADDGLGWV